MTYERCWTEANLKRYFTTEAMTKDAEAFQQVHVPIDKIRVDRECTRGVEAGFIGESDLLELITQSEVNEPNRIFLVVGETGCGKSELCQWLKYNIADGVHVPILISRSMVKLSRIVEEIHSHLPGEGVANVADITEFKPVTVSTNLKARLLLDLELMKARLRTRDRNYLWAIADDSELVRLLEHNFREYVREINILHKERAMDLLPRSDFEDLIARRGWDLPKEPFERYFEIVRKAITDCLAEQLNVGDLIEKLGLISERYVAQAQRPVLLIEDITTWGFLKNDLLDYLFELSAGHYDVVIGVTSGFERGHREDIFGTQETMKARLSGRFELTTGSSTLFLQDNYQELARKYLRAVKRDCEGCARLDSCQAAFGRDLYPFYAAFLTKIYEHLQEEGNLKQTPRLFLNTLQQVLSSAKIPSEGVGTTGYVSDVVVTFYEAPDQKRRFKNALRWYGQFDAVGETVTVPEGILTALDVPIPDSALVQDGQVIVSKRIGLRPRPEREVEEEEVRIPSEDERILAEFDAWLERGDVFPSRNELKKGVLSVIGLFGLEPFALKHPGCNAREAKPLIYSRGQREATVYLDGSGDDYRYTKIVVPRRDKELLNQMLALGRDQIQVTDERVNLVDMEAWARARSDEVQKELRTSLESDLGFSIEDFALLLRYLQLNLLDGRYSMEPATFLSPLVSNSMPAFSDLPHFDKAARPFFEKGGAVEGLYLAFFYYSEKLIDYSLLEATSRRLQERDPVACLGRIARVINVSAVPDAFVVGNTKLRELVYSARRYAHYLIEVDTDPIRWHLVYLQRLSELPLAEVEPAVYKAKVEKLVDRASRISLTWRQAWDTPLKLLRTESLDFAGFAARVEAVCRGYDQDMNIFECLSFLREVQEIRDAPEHRVLVFVRELAETVKRVCSVEAAGPSLQETAEYKRFETLYQETQRLAQ